VYDVVADYQTTLERLCRSSVVNVNGDSTEVATGTEEQSGTMKLALRKTLRSFAFCAPWTMRLGRIHAFLTKHCPNYAKSCLAVQPPTMLMNLSALNDPTITSTALVAVEYRANLLTAADGRMMSFSYIST